MRDFFTPSETDPVDDVAQFLPPQKFFIFLSPFRNLTWFSYPPRKRHGWGGCRFFTPSEIHHFPHPPQNLGGFLLPLRKFLLVFLSPWKFRDFLLILLWFFKILYWQLYLMVGMQFSVVKFQIQKLNSPKTHFQKLLGHLSFLRHVINYKQKYYPSPTPFNVFLIHSLLFAKTRCKVWTIWKVLKGLAWENIMCILDICPNIFEYYCAIHTETKTLMSTASVRLELCWINLQQIIN